MGRPPERHPPRPLAPPRADPTAALRPDRRDEVGHLPVEQDAANLFLQLVSSRYEHASLILTSNLALSGWGGVFGDQAVAAAMIDRVLRHADVLTTKGASYHPRHRGIDTLPASEPKARHTRTTNPWPRIPASQRRILERRRDKWNESLQPASIQFRLGSGLAVNGHADGEQSAASDPIAATSQGR